jgi:hypothetical protein
MRDGLRAVLLAIVAAITAAAAFGRLTPPRASDPIGYRGDAFAFLAGVVAARDGHVVPFRTIHIPELNAPYGADWNDFPNRQPTLLWSCGVLARAFGPFAAVDLVTLAGPAVAALVFYLVARRLRARWEFAAAGALAFALSPVYFHRAPEHLALAHYWHLPWCLLVSGWAFSRRGIERRGRLRSGLGAAAAAGLGNFYYAVVFVQLLLFGALAQALRRRPRAALAALVVAVVTVGVVAAENAYYLVHRWREGPNPGAVTRSYGDVERFALKPVELILPWRGHGLLGDSALLTRYWADAFVVGEKGGAYVGVVGAACLVALLGGPVAAALRRRRAAISPSFLGALWVLSFSVVGGFNGVASLVLPPWVRATNRFGVVLLAMAVLSASVRASRRARCWSRSTVAAVAAGVVALAVVDGAKGAGIPSVGPRRVRVAADDEAFARQLEAQLARDAMVFMLPVQPFPEWPAPLPMGAYEHFRPYLFARRLRFSYGTDRGRGSEAWQADVERLGPAPMIEALERYGFSGVVLNRSGLPHEGEELLRAFESAGRRATAAVGNLVFVPLKPRPDPELPAPATARPPA